MSFKKLSLGFSFLIVPTVVGSTAVACSCAVNGEPEERIEERIVDYFNNYAFRLIAIQEETYEAVLSRFNAGYFRDSLVDQELANGFDRNALEVLRLTDTNGETLTDADFRDVGTQFEARIVYNYGEFIDQVANATISIEDNATLNLLLRIFETPYEIEVEANTPVADLYQKINPEFIKQGLRDRGLGDDADAFDDLEFEFTNIQHREDENTLIEINANDLRTFGEYPEDYWRFYYKYANFGRVGRVVPQARITIKVIARNEAEIVNTINGAQYEATALRSSQYNALKSRINANFIKTQLSEELQADFNDEAFSLVSITDAENNQELTDEDFAEFRIHDARIHYNYGSLTDQIVPLKLRVIARNEDEIVNAINTTQFETEITFGSEYETLIANIDNENDDFIKNYLSPELQTSFDSELFILHRVTDADDNQITDEDLESHRVIDARIHYDYGSSVDQVANLTVNVIRYRLENIFKTFHTQDRKRVPNFLDSNNLATVQNQIEEFLGISFADGGLMFDPNTQTATSVLIKATEESDFFQEETTITWNLKLAEIWGRNMDESVTDPDLKAGLKSYLYLEANTNLVKLFDPWRIIDGRRARIYTGKNAYHRLRFVNNNEARKDFTFQGTWWTDEVAGRFGEFNYGANMNILLTSEEANRVRFYRNNRWNNGTNNQTYRFDRLGNASWS